MKKERTDAVRKTLRQWTTAAFVCLLAVCLLKKPEVASVGVLQGMDACLGTLVPSLFPFMVLSCYLTESGIASRCGKIGSFLMHHVFRLPGCAAPVLLLGLIGGYPAGAKTAARLMERGELTHEQAGRLLCFCISAGPPFVLTTVGACLLGNHSAGIILLLSLSVAALLLGLLTRFFCGKENEMQILSPAAPAASPFVSAVFGASRAMASMCAFVVVFSVLLALIRDTGVIPHIVRNLLLLGVPPGDAAALPSFISEVTSGCRDGALMRASLPLFAFGLGWGGLCVHLQIFSFFEKFPIPRLKFWIYRLLHGILSASITWQLLPFFPEYSTASSIWSQEIQGAMASSVPAAAALFLLLLVMALDGSGITFRKRAKTSSNT